MQELIEAHQPPELALSRFPGAPIAEQRLTAIDRSEDDDIVQSKPPQTRRQSEGDRQRQDAMSEDMNRQRREPAREALLAMRDPEGLQHKVGAVRLEREEQKKHSKRPEKT